MLSCGWCWILQARVSRVMYQRFMLGVSDEVFNISLEIVQLAVHYTLYRLRGEKEQNNNESNATNSDTLRFVVPILALFTKWARIDSFPSFYLVSLEFLVVSVDRIIAGVSVLGVLQVRPVMEWLSHNRRAKNRQTFPPLLKPKMHWDCKYRKCIAYRFRLYKFPNLSNILWNTTNKFPRCSLTN